MSLKSARASLGKISKSLETVRDSREFLIKNTRQIVILCSQSIIAVHRGDMDSARTKAKRADSLLRSQRARATNNLRRHIAVPEQELVEAFSLIAVADKRPVPSAAALAVSGPSYVLGLLDCIGELKRLVFDRIRAGRTKEAQGIFQVMEELYELLYPFATYDKVLKEAKRKLDVNRMLIEDVRAVITEEMRRSDLIDAIARLTSR